MSIVSDLFDRIRVAPKITDDESHHWDEYLALLQSLAADEIPDAESALAIISAVGKTQQEVDSETQTMRIRLEQRAILDRSANARDEIRKVEKQIQKLSEEFAKVQQQHRETLAPLTARQFELTNLCDSAQSAERNLKRTVVDQRLTDEINRVQTMKRNLQSEINAISNELRVSVSNSPANSLTVYRQTLAKVESGKHGSIRKGSDDHQKVINRIEVFANQVSNLESKRNLLNDRQNELSNRLDELMQEALKP